MAGYTAQGTEATFDGFSIVVTGFSHKPQGEILVDMTGMGDLLGANVMTPSGEKTPGSITIDYIADGDLSSPESIIGTQSTLTITGPYSLSLNAVCTGGTVEAAVGDIVRGSLEFTLTDYYG